MKKQYTVKQLEKLMEEDLKKCASAFERGMVRAICGMEIRARREEEMITVRCACIK